MDDETEEYESREDGKSSISADLIRGHINTIILRSLYDRDKYGYEIINEINEKSHGQYTLKQPTLYSALKRLETQGYIQAYWKSDEVSSGGRRKYFRLTESGKEITEKNQAEWEYSRTVIDNLISDKNFDFSQPAPTPVDFKYLKQSTSRVPSLHGEEGGEEKPQGEQAENNEQQEKPAVQVLAEPVIEAVTFTALHETSVVLQPDEVPSYGEESEKQDNAEAKEPEAQQTEQPQETPQVTEESTAQTAEAQTAAEQPVTTEQTVEQTVEQTAGQTVEQTIEQAAAPEAAEIPAEPATATQETGAQPAYDALELAKEQEILRLENERLRYENQQIEEQRRIAHENYERLIKGEYGQPQEPKEVPAAKNINTENLIYNNRPETERDYKNLIDKLFYNALKPSSNTQPVPPQPAAQEIPQEQPQPQQQPVSYVRSNANYYNANEKAATDGLKIYTSESQTYSEKARQSTYNKGATLFKCSLIVGVIILLEFTICVIFQDSLNVSLGYPFVILALGLADILVCGILYGAGYGRQVRKPNNLMYLITSGIVTFILIIIIILFAVVISVNWSSTADVMAKVVIPCIIALNIPIFTLSFYVLTK